MRTDADGETEEEEEEMGNNSGRQRRQRREEALARSRIMERGREADDAGAQIFTCFLSKPTHPA